MTEIIIFDSSVLIDNLRTGRHQTRIASTAGLIRMSVVVLAELWRGATSVAEQRFLREMERNQPVLIPTKDNWIDSGQLLAKMRTTAGFGPEKLRDLHFDILIALTARSHGARVITSNSADFMLIQRYRKFELEIW